MRRGPILTGLSAVLLLAACHKQATIDVKDKSPQAVASSVKAAGMTFNPGRWETTVEMTKFDIGKELPPQARDMMKAMMGKTRNIATCLSKEKAEKPDPQFFGKPGEGCTYDHFTMGDGKIDSKMVCKSPEGGSMTMTMAGHYTAESYDMKVSSSGEQGGMPVSMDLAMTAKRTGACNGSELK